MAIPPPPSDSNERPEKKGTLERLWRKATNPSSVFDPAIEALGARRHQEAAANKRLELIENIDPTLELGKQAPRIAALNVVILDLLRKAYDSGIEPAAIRNNPLEVLKAQLEAGNRTHTKAYEKFAALYESQQEGELDYKETWQNMTEMFDEGKRAEEALERGEQPDEVDGMSGKLRAGLVVLGAFSVFAGIKMVNWIKSRREGPVKKTLSLLGLPVAGLTTMVGLGAAIGPQKTLEKCRDWFGVELTDESIAYIKKAAEEKRWGDMLRGLSFSHRFPELESASKRLGLSATDLVDYKDVKYGTLLEFKRKLGNNAKLSFASAAESALDFGGWMYRNTVDHIPGTPDADGFLAGMASRWTDSQLEAMRDEVQEEAKIMEFIEKNAAILGGANLNDMTIGEIFKAFYEREVFGKKEGKQEEKESSEKEN